MKNKLEKLGKLFGKLSFWIYTCSNCNERLYKNENFLWNDTNDLKWVSSLTGTSMEYVHIN